MANELLNEAISLIKSGDKQAGRKLLAQYLQTNPHSESAWLWLVGTLSSDTERIKTLEQCLKLNPGSQVTRQALDKLKSRQAPPAAPVTPVSVEVATPLSQPVIDKPDSVQSAPIIHSQEPTSPQPVVAIASPEVPEVEQPVPVPSQLESLISRPTATAEQPAFSPLKPELTPVQTDQPPFGDLGTPTPQVSPEVIQAIKPVVTSRRTIFLRWVMIIAAVLLCITVVGAAYFVFGGPLASLIKPTFSAVFYTSPTLGEATEVTPNQEPIITGPTSTRPVFIPKPSRTPTITLSPTPSPTESFTPTAQATRTLTATITPTASGTAEPKK